ncbi:dihydrofolate reductase [Flaviflexus massiliensis]|uniref:dihydrofolate reductase n=1 Tax=Flaviflexus massiliensis TaxID=1522309 RepID=UPI0006D5862A
MSLVAIWAQAHGRAIGRDGTMPWHLPEDLAHFKRMTTGHPVIMGSRTYDSLGEKYRPLRGRRNIVITRSNREFPGCETVSSLKQARDMFADELAWIMGGAQIYEAAMPYLDGIVVTDIDMEVEGADAFAPPLPDWDVVGAEPDRGWLTSKNGLQYRFTALAKRGSSPWDSDPFLTS